MLHKRDIREESTFGPDLRKLFPSPKEADEILDSTTTFLSMLADTGESISGTNVFYKVAADLPRGRWLVVYYTIEPKLVALHSIKSFPV
jgi:hypothetical protein